MPQTIKQSEVAFSAGSPVHNAPKNEPSNITGLRFPLVVWGLWPLLSSSAQFVLLLVRLESDSSTYIAPGRRSTNRTGIVSRAPSNKSDKRVRSPKHLTKDRTKSSAFRRHSLVNPDFRCVLWPEAFYQRCGTRFQSAFRIRVHCCSNIDLTLVYWTLRGYGAGLGDGSLAGRNCALSASW